MSIQTQIDRIAQNVSSTYSVLSDMGATIPEEQNTDNLPNTAANITAVLYGKKQNLTDEQKAQAKENIGLEDNPPAIIDVVELPTENIREDCFYRVLTASFLYGQYIKNDWTMYTVTELPETGEMCWDGTIAVAYYSVADNTTYGYVDANVSAAMGVPVGWYTADILIPAVGQPYGGVISDITQASDNTVYTYLQNVVHSYKDGVWNKIDIIGWRGTGESSEIFNHLSNTASGSCSHAEGLWTAAEGYASHAEGGSTTASGDRSHAEGDNTAAEGYASHAEGLYTTASGSHSHAEGEGTTASGRSQHVQGEYNIVDPEHDPNDPYKRVKYAHIVGNGANDLNCSNAHTLDWSGNAWFQGTIKLGGTSQDDAPDEVATKANLVELENYILNINYDATLAFDTSEIVFNSASATSSVLGQAILGQMVLA